MTARRIYSPNSPARPCGPSSLWGRSGKALLVSEKDPITEHVWRVVDAAPPLSPEVRDRLRELFRFSRTEAAPLERAA